MIFDWLFFRLAALKSPAYLAVMAGRLAVPPGMPTFFALRVEKIAASNSHKSYLGGLYIRTDGKIELAEVETNH